MGIYVQVIKDLVTERQFTVYIHPVPPALDVTRSIVTAYNAVLKKSIVELSQLNSYKGRVHWLDFFRDLVTEDGLQLKPDLKFDDTHLSPRYLGHLAEALTKSSLSKQ